MHRISAVRILILALLGGTTWRPVPAADVPSAAELAKLGLEVRWNNQAIIDVGRDKVVHVSNDENNVYVQTSAGVLTTFDAENGRRLWSAQTGRSDEPAMAAVSNSRIVIVVAGPAVYGYNKFTGAPLIRFRLKRQPSASPVMGDGVFYVPCAGGALYTYSTSVLEYLFRYGSLPDDVAIPHSWRFICNESIIFPPVNGLEAVAFVTEAGNLHSVNTTGLARGRSRLQMVLKKPATAPLAIADNDSSSSIIMLTGDNRVFSIDLIKGNVEWTYPMGRPMSTDPIVVGNEVFVVTTDGTLTRFSRDRLSPDWGRPVEIAKYDAPVLIGAGMEDVAIHQQLQNDLEVGGQGVRITTVVNGSPAAQAGLQPGDILVNIGGLPTGTVDTAREMIEAMPLRVERSFDVIRVATGMLLDNVRFNPPLSIPDSDQPPITRGVVVADVLRGSVAANGGIRAADILLAVGDTQTDSVETALNSLATAAPGPAKIQILRDGAIVDSELLLLFSAPRPGETSTVSRQTLKLRIPVTQWNVGGISGLTAVGRFSVFGIDQTNRLVGFDRRTSKMAGRVAVRGFGVHLHNALTDQIYLISSTGDVLCLREIGPTVRLPDLSSVSNRAQVKSVKVKEDDPIEPAGTVVCEVEFPDGTVHEISADAKGVVSRVYVKPGQLVSVDDPLILISDDKFATYHRRPQQQPIDVKLQDENAAAPAP